MGSWAIRAFFIDAMIRTKTLMKGGAAVMPLHLPLVVIPNSIPRRQCGLRDPVEASPNTLMQRDDTTSSAKPPKTGLHTIR